MKNLFKNLMLVAVAAMAFTACTETNDEVNAVTKKVVLEFVADLADDDTRVAFGEKDGNKYPTVWEAYDNVTVTVGDKTASYTLTEEDVLESGKKAVIRPEFELVGDETLSGDIVATVNESVSFDNHQGNKPTISLKAEAVYPATTLAFEHQYAYGKMELVGLPAEFNVTEVKLNLVGGGNTLNHTINGYSVEDNIFWFTTEAMEAVESFSVYASNGAETYYKEVTVEKAFAFEVGHVSAFRVKELVVKPADFNVQLTKITSMSNNVIRFEGDDAEDNITISFNPGLENIVAGHYVAVEQDWFNGGEWAWTDATALEVKNEFQGSSVDVNAAGGGEWYYNHNGVDVTVDGDVYTIVAHLQNYTSNGNQTVDFTYVGKLEVAGSGSEPEEPFAEYIATDLSFNDDGDLVFVVDAYETFKVRLNSADRPNNTTIKEGEYAGINSSTVANGQFSVSQKIKGGYTEGWTSTKTTSTMTVEYVDGQYLIIVDYISAWEGSGEVGYKGVPNEWVVPGGESGGDEPVNPEPVQLATPTASATDITANSITVSWNAVANASNYAVTINGGAPQTISDTSYTFTDLEAETSYVITVVAKGNGAEYLDSEPATVNATTSAAQTGDGEGDSYDFVIPGEGVAYGYDYKYTALVDGLDKNNKIRVKQENGWIWDIFFNPGLSAIDAGDYEPTHYFTNSTALEVDTYNGGFQNDTFNYIYPDSFDLVTTFNVQKQGDIYCITMIGSGGYGNSGNKTFRCVYIGKIK